MMTEEEEVEGGEHLPQRDIEDGAEIKSGGEQERNRKGEIPIEFSLVSPS